MNYPTRVAVVEMHVVNNGYPGYCYEANQRMGFYQSPYYTPWLYRDGTSVGNSYTTWRSGIVSRMGQASPFTATMWGTYDPVTRNGTINAKYRNDSTAAITARVYFVITEDSLYYQTPIGDWWHNHVARDYLPTQVGTQVTIASGDSAVQTRSFAISSAWNANRCKIVSWIQADAPSRNNYQAGMKKVNELTTAVHESGEIKTISTVNAKPNPCANKTTFSFGSPAGVDYRISIYDIAGRQVKTLTGVSGMGITSVLWNCTTDNHTRVTAGVYLYELQCGELQAKGKIIVR